MPGCEVAIGSERGETSRQVRTDDARKKKDESEEAKAVQSRDRTLCAEAVHRPEFGQDVRAEEEQARDIAKDELRLEDHLRGHRTSLSNGDYNHRRMNSN